MILTGPKALTGSRSPSLKCTDHTPQHIPIRSNPLSPSFRLTKASLYQSWYSWLALTAGLKFQVQLRLGHCVVFLSQKIFSQCPSPLKSVSEYWEDVSKPKNLKGNPAMYGHPSFHRVSALPAYQYLWNRATHRHTYDEPLAAVSILNLQGNVTLTA